MGDYDYKEGNRFRKAVLRVLYNTWWGNGRFHWISVMCIATMLIRRRGKNGCGG